MKQARSVWNRKETQELMKLSGLSFVPYYKTAERYACKHILTLTWVGFLGVRFEVDVGGGVKLPPPLLSKNR